MFAFFLKGKYLRGGLQSNVTLNASRNLQVKFKSTCIVIKFNVENVFVIKNNFIKWFERFERLK